MLVLAAVPRTFTARLRQAAGERFAFREAACWDSVLEAIRHLPIEVAVLDPALEGEPRAREIERLGVLFPSLPRLLYTTLSPTMAPILLRLGKAGVGDVVVSGHDDHPQRLSELLITAAANAVSRQLMEEIGDLLRDWPGELRWAIETIIQEPAALHTVQQLADRARMDRRTCARWFTKAHLPPPSVMLMVFRVVYAHRLLQDPGYTVEDVAAKLGYAKVRSFAQNVKEVFGMTPGELRVSLAPADAVESVRDRYFRPAGRPELAVMSG